MFKKRYKEGNENILSIKKIRRLKALVKGYSGLTDSEASIIREKNGTNELKAYKKTSFFSSYIKNLSDPIIRVLIIAFFITLLFSGSNGGVLEAAGIGASIVISTFVSTLSEYGSERAFRKMQQEASRQLCTVIRNGNERKIGVNEVVCGDVLVLRAGDKVAADCIIISGEIACDMSAINGESRDKRKKIAPVNADLGNPSDDYSVYRGCLVTSGEAMAEVKTVGKETYYGIIAGELQIQDEESPLRRKLSSLASTISKFGYFCAFAVAVSHLIYTFAFDPSFVFSAKGVLKELVSAFALAVSVVVVAVPEGLPMMITVVLSSNMIRMQKQNIRVRKPIGIETSGSVDILFSDKTGTLTYGKAKAVCYVTGEGDRAPKSVHLSPLRKELVTACAIYGGSSRIEIGRSGKRITVGGDASETALLDEVLGCGGVSNGVSRVEYLPFDSRMKLSYTVVDVTRNRELSKLHGKNLALIKGAPEMLIRYCTQYYTKEGTKAALNNTALLKNLDTMMSKGMRVLAIVTADPDIESAEGVRVALNGGEDVEVSRLLRNACFVCLVGLRDEARREAKKAVLSLKNAGVQTVMVTGDARLTAEAIAREVGIIDGNGQEAVIESTDMKRMSDAELISLLPSLRVVARAMPDDKSRLVRIAKSVGRVTAMTGDGLNDAPALRAADVGFAMGSGTDVAKEAGDIIINNNDISTIRKAVLYGRTVFRSIRKFIVFQLVMNLSAVGISIIGPFVGFESPVTVVQMLWINLIMDTLAAIAFAGEAPSERFMHEPPIKRSEGVLNGDMLTRIFVMGIFTVMLCLYYCVSDRIAVVFGGRTSAEFTAGFFALFVFCGVAGAFVARSARANILSGLMQNTAFIVVMSVVFCAQLGMIYFGGEAFRCAPLSFERLKTVSLLASLCIPYGVTVELLLRKRKIPPQ